MIYPLLVVAEPRPHVVWCGWGCDKHNMGFHVAGFVVLLQACFLLRLTLFFSWRAVFSILVFKVLLRSVKIDVRWYSLASL